MIITSRKALKDIEEALAPHRTLAVIGCGLCAATCDTGGRKEVGEMARHFSGKGKEIVAELVVDGVCHKRLVDLLSRKERVRLERAEAFLILACGSGTQTAAEVFPQPVYAGLETLFLGQIRRHGEFREVCMLCGDCLLEGVASICPITRCPKSLVNGPCGGAEEGRCEVNSEDHCVWVDIFEERSRRGELEKLRKITPLRDYSRSTHPGRVKTRK